MALIPRIGKLPTVQKFSTPGSTNYAVTPGTKYIKVRIAGAGGGGSGNGNNGGPGQSGGASSFGSLVSCPGGNGGGNGGGIGGAAPTINSPAIALNIVQGQKGGAARGSGTSESFFMSGAGGSSGFGPGGGEVNNGSQSGRAKGSGGSGGSGAATTPGGGGGAGTYVEFIVFNPFTIDNGNFTVIIGALGVGGTPGTNGDAGGDGVDGYAEITEYQS